MDYYQDLNFQCIIINGKQNLALVSQSSIHVFFYVVLEKVFVSLVKNNLKCDTLLK